MFSISSLSNTRQRSQSSLSPLAPSAIRWQPPIRDRIEAARRYLLRFAAAKRYALETIAHVGRSTLVFFPCVEGCGTWCGLCGTRENMMCSACGLATQKRGKGRVQYPDWTGENRLSALTLCDKNCQDNSRNSTISF